MTPLPLQRHVPPQALIAVAAKAVGAAAVLALFLFGLPLALLVGFGG